MYVGTPSAAENGNTRGKQTILKRVAIFRSKLYLNKNICNTLRMLFLYHNFVRNGSMHITSFT